MASGRGTAGGSGLTGRGSGVVTGVKIAAGMGGCVGGMVGGWHDSGAHSAGVWKGGLWVGGMGGSGCGFVGRGSALESLSESGSGGRHSATLGGLGQDIGGHWIALSHGDCIDLAAELGRRKLAESAHEVWIDTDNKITLPGL